MVKSKIPAARKNDVKFFDLTTGEVVCTFNGCRHKFTIEGNHEVTNDPVVGMDDDDKFIRVKVVSDSFYHQCNECGRKVSNRADRSKSIRSYFKEKGNTVMGRGRTTR